MVNQVGASCWDSLLWYITFVYWVEKVDLWSLWICYVSTVFEDLNRIYLYIFSLISLPLHCKILSASYYKNELGFLKGCLK